ncbi:MAG: hypothetical protein C0483_14395 [Pirellula sp.]|nr:hypothetical protein [Pirellula sp.]
MKPIDFLPERYRQAKKRRHTSFFRLGVTLLFVAAFAAAAGGLHFKQLDVRRQSENINKQYAAAQSQSALLANKQAELAKLNVYAALVTHLRHPWPKSRLIDELVAPLPPEVVLAKVEITAVPRPMIATGEAAAASTDSAEAKKPTVETDLATLRTQAEQEDILIHIEGTTHDQTSLHLYLQALLASRLFVAAELTAVEAAPTNGPVEQATPAVRRDRFTAVVKVRPAYGLPGGPSLDAPPAKPVHAALSLAPQGAAGP